MCIQRLVANTKKHLKYGTWKKSPGLVVSVLFETVLSNTETLHFHIVWAEHLFWLVLTALFLHASPYIVSGIKTSLSSVLLKSKPLGYEMV